MTLSLPTDPLRVSLEGSSERWFFWLLVASGVVAFGCVLEIGETWLDLTTWLRARRAPHNHDEEAKSWRVPLAAAGLLLVIVGVIGEGIFEGLASKADTKLRTYEANRITAAEADSAEAIRNAGTAKQSADNAETAALRADSAASSAVAASETAESKAKIADSRANSAERQAVAANSRAGMASGVATSAVHESSVALESAHHALLEAESIAPRDIDPKLLSSLKQFGPLRYILRCEGDSLCSAENEISHFANVIDIGFGLLGWTRDKMTGPLSPIDPSASALLAIIIPGWMVHTGVAVGCSQTEAETSPCASAAHSLVDTLNTAGVSATYIPLLERLPSQELMIDVWQIPSPHDRERIQSVWEQSKRMRQLSVSRDHGSP